MIALWSQYVYGFCAGFVTVFYLDAWRQCRRARMSEAAGKTGP